MMTGNNTWGYSRLPDILWIWLGVAVSVGICGFLFSALGALGNMTLLVSSIGASALIIYAEAGSPAARPRNVIFGHIISGLTGVVFNKLCGEIPWLSGALAVAFATVAMLVAKTFHPPGGATALIAVIGDKRIHDLGFLFPFMPVGMSVCIIVGIAHVVNNKVRGLRYPASGR